MNSTEEFMNNNLYFLNKTRFHLRNNCLRYDKTIQN